jgi:hypothetical protein
MKTAMKRSARRLLVAGTAALAAMAYGAAAAPAVSWADCENGAWWDPVAGVCRAPVAPQPLNCEFGSLWNPLDNTCVAILPRPQ